MKKQQLSRGAIMHPPQFSPTFKILGKRLRFQATAASPGLQLTMIHFGDLWCLSTLATQATQIASHCRLKAIEMWAPPAASLVPVTVAIDWTGGTVGGFGKSTRVSDTAVGSAQPAHIRSSPPLNSQIAQWFAANSNTEVCRISFPAGAIIDITYDVVVRDDASVAIVTGAVAGAAPGAVYVRALDSVTSTANLPPISIATI